MADDEDDDNDADEGWIFAATGNSCPICTALDGHVFASEPDRPHDSCDCDIVPRGRERRECGDNDWEITHVEALHPDNYTLHFKVDIRVNCWNGASPTTSFEIDMTAPYHDNINTEHGEEFLMDLESLIFDAVADQAEEFMAQSCKACGPPLLA